MSQSRPQPNLEFLGIDPGVEDAYRMLLRTGGADGSDPQLVELGLAASGAGGRLRPTPPAKLVDLLVARRVARLQDELETAAVRTGIVDSLLAERESALAAGAGSGPSGAGQGAGGPIQRLEALDDVMAAIDEMTFFARTENLTTNTRGILSPQAIERSRPNDMRVLRRGIRMRTLMAAPALDDAPTMAYLRELVDKGAEIRISQQPLERMIVCDRTAALTPLDPADSSRGALLIRESGLVSALVSLFERMWSTAQELPAATDGANEGPGRPTGMELRVLESLYSAEKDETGARDLCISVRTYRKHVASLMHRLEATNRFQVALLARERGWL
ncbi:helix-turn-helix transcriptional regulator [Streptomyces sp. NPDC021093]|uniref:helix-turn-helix transcriptional regulator n=1 Tax=Streptomyces sp. NPDC021093 TaxID=3365112 RepID=UPI0037A009E9